MIIKPCTDDARSLACAQYLSSRPPKTDATVFILPIPSFRDGIHVTGTSLTIERLSFPRRAILAGYGIPGAVRAYVEAADGSVIDVSENEGFATANARLCAIGTLGHILLGSTRAPHDMAIGVIGYGRIGRELVALLLFLGARVKVFSTSPRTRLLLGDCGIESDDPSEPGTGRYVGLDVLVNTAPVSYLKEGDVDGDTVVFDLSSCIEPTAVPSCKRLPALPARLYPTSAGAIYARAILEKLSTKGGDAT